MSDFSHIIKSYNRSIINEQIFIKYLHFIILKHIYNQKEIIEEVDIFVIPPSKLGPKIKVASFKPNLQQINNSQELIEVESKLDLYLLEHINEFVIIEKSREEVLYNHTVEDSQDIFIMKNEKI